MEAGVEQFTKFISGEITLVIPVYQRNYNWLKANCEQLFTDIIRILENKKPHFIGTFVYQYNPVVGARQEYIIIDGQQRITSIILFAKALYDSTDDAELKSDIRSKFIKHTTGRGLRNKCRLRPNEFDRTTFEKLMSDDDFEEDNFTAQEKSYAMYKNYLFFREKISGAKFKPEKLCDAITQLNIVAIMLKDENAQEIFESLNSTGLDLSQADLIRNFLLMPLNYDRQEELYKNYWLEIENLLRPSDNVENFMIQYLIVKLRSNDAYSSKLNSKTLYAMFKRYFADKCGEAETCLKDMYRYAKFFRRFIFNDDTKFENLSAVDKKFYELVFLIKANNAPSILMYLLDRYEEKIFDETTFIEFLDVLISFVFRSRVCRGSGLTAQFAGNFLARLHKESNLNTTVFWKAITFGTGKATFPKDEEFNNALTNENLYKTLKSDGCKYLLYSLERQARAKELPAYSEATVEHILPQKPSDDWKQYLKDRNDSQSYELRLHTLGNLTLTGENSALGNADFDSKKKIYSRSNFFYTRALKDYPEWTSKQIRGRAKKMATTAIKIWTLPEEYSVKLINIGDVFNLDSDFGALRGTKPAIVSIFATEIKIGSWSELLREVIKNFYAYDEDTFRQAVQSGNIPRRGNLFSANPRKNTKTFKIDEDYYMGLSLGTEECLRIIKTFAEYFDRHIGTNFKENIWFTLRRD